MANYGTVITPEIKKIIKKFKNEGRSMSEVAQKVKGLYPEEWSYDKIYNSVKKQYYRLNDLAKKAPSKEKNVEQMKKECNCLLSKEIKKDGSTAYEGRMTTENADGLKPEDVMKHDGLDPTLWEVLSFKMNKWQQGSKNGSVLDLYQFKLTVKPTQAEVVRTTTEEAINLIDYSKIKPAKFSVSHVAKGDNILAINIADLHFGLKVDEFNVGEDYDKAIARNRILNALKDVYDNTYYLKLAKVQLVTLGDFVHVDNSKQTTTAGTFQQIDGSYELIVAEAMELMAEIIETTRKLWKVPVDYLYVRGNHDSDMGFSVANSMVHRYKDCPDITFDGGNKVISAKPHKAMHYNGVLCGYSHGTIGKKNKKVFMPQIFRKEYGECEHPNSFFFMGHEHHYAVETVTDVSTIVCPTLCGPSNWEHGQGYNAPKALRYSIFYANGSVGGGNVYARDDEVSKS